MELFFEFQLSDLLSSLDNNDGENISSEFDRILISRWQAASNAGVCRYQLTKLKTKILPGKYGFVAQVYKQIELS
jgi:GDP-D-glucose phosphorylase